ncbi:synaptotagmin-12-like [Hetaerina americana]|uniref:synaptotagmin-12-like n=1 Tax=Hetaerina americana TaxID=62018 RepID=UPI003A7F42FB
MGAQVAVGLALGALCVAVALIAAVACCRCLWVIWPHSTAWLLSSREEKVGLTRAGAGHYSANGYLITSDSDIRLDVAAGSFQRFDPVDRDFRVVLAETSACGGGPNPWSPPPPGSSGSPPPASSSSIAPASIPPQPLRPAPAPKRSQLPSVSSTSSASSTSPPPASPPPPPPPPRPPAPNFTTSSTALTFSSLLQQSASLPEKDLGPPPPVPEPPRELVEAPEGMMMRMMSQDMMIGNVPGLAPDLPPELPPELPPPLLRASSFDSVCSDTSVDLSDLEVGNPGEPQVTGFLCVGIEYDSDCCDLIVSVLEAKDLRGTDGVSPASDTYVRVLLLPDKTSHMQTRVYRRSSCPTYKEKFLFVVDGSAVETRSLQFYVYASDRYSNTLIGEAELRLSDVTARRQPVTTWLTLTDTGSQRGTEFGEVMFSLSYLPTAERLTVVVVKARNLRFSAPHAGDPFVKVYLLQRGKKVHKKRTTARKGERSPIFNEAMIFSVPAHALQTIQLRVTVADSSDIAIEGGVGRGAARSVGHVIVGSQATGKALSHWSQMLSSLRKPIAMWHALRK